MKHNKQSILIIALLSAFGMASTATGQTVYVTDLDVNPIVALHSVDSDSRPFEKDSDKPLGLRFSLENLSSSTLETAVIGVYLYTASGKPKGSYSYLVDTEVPAFGSA